MPGVGYQAGGNITPKSIVQLATVAEPNNVGNTPATAGFQVILSSGVNTPMVGISGQSTRFIQIQNPPVSTSIGNPNDGFHAVSGENCLVFLIGQVAPLIAGVGGLTAGDLVTSDASGHGVTATTGQYYVGQAQMTVVAGAECPVRVQPGLHQ